MLAATEGSLRSEIPLREVKNSSDLMNKDVELVTKDGNEYNGVIINYDNKGNVVVGFGGGKATVNLEDIESIKALDEGRDSLDYNKTLSENKIPRYSYRYNPETLSNMEGKYLEVTYGDIPNRKKFEGKVVGTHYVDSNNHGLIIEDRNGQVKHIKTHRIGYIDELGDNEQEYKYTKDIQNVTAEVADHLNSRNFTKMPNDFEYDTEVHESLDTYFDERIKEKETGEPSKIANEYAKIDWNDELDYTGDLRNDSQDDIAYSEETIEKVQEYYDGRVAAVDDVIYSVEQVDWTKHGKTQKEGEIEALNYIRDNGVLRFPEDFVHKKD